MEKKIVGTYDVTDQSKHIVRAGSYEIVEDEVDIMPDTSAVYYEGFDRQGEKKKEGKHSKRKFLKKRLRRIIKNKQGALGEVVSKFTAPLTSSNAINWDLTYNFQVCGWTVWLWCDRCNPRG